MVIDHNDNSDHVDIEDDDGSEHTNNTDDDDNIDQSTHVFYAYTLIHDVLEDNITPPTTT